MNFLMVLFGFILIDFYHHVDCKGVSECYSCYEYGGCSDPLKKETCLSSSSWQGCKSQIKTYPNGDVFVTKGCVYFRNIEEALCDAANKNEGNSCYICEEDLCNSAGIYSIPAIIMAILLFLMKIF